MTKEVKTVGQNAHTISRYNKTINPRWILITVSTTHISTYIIFLPIWIEVYFLEQFNHIWPKHFIKACRHACSWSNDGDEYWKLFKVPPMYA